jgi:type 1 glutamine amidotransferase
MLKRLCSFVLAAVFTQACVAAEKQWVNFAGAANGPAKGKKVVLISGDEEYRSEEGLTQLGKILAANGYDATVLYSINPESGEIDPNYGKNIPGLEALDSADLMVILTRFRDLPDEQMKHIDDYLKSGKPVIGLRTATHAFNIGKGKPYERYSYNYKGTDFEQGFGRQVLGETWISHHGGHKKESTVGLIAPGSESSPILSGIKSGEIWGATDVYGVRLPLPGDSKPLVLGQVTKADHPQDMNDKNFGMRPTDKTPVDGAKNSPMMPVAWTKSYQLPGGKQGRAFCTTMGSSTDLENEPLRRLIVNAAFDLTGVPVPPGGASVAIVGDYKPTAYGFRKNYKTGLKPADLQK